MTSRGSMMERLRAELLRRARAERQEDVEQGITDTPTQQQPVNTGNGPRIRLLQLQLPVLPSLFSNRRPPRRQNENDIESPKSPEFVSRRPPTLPPMHLDFSSLADSLAQNANTAREPPSGHHSVTAPSSVYSQDHSLPVQPARPEPVAMARSTRTPSPVSSRSASLDTPDPAEAELARLGTDGRRRHERQQRRRAQAERANSERSRKQKSPKRFLFCFPWVKSRRMRSQILRCFVSGTFLLVLLAVYLALSLTKSMNSGEFTIVLILVVLCATVFFCHALLRLFLLVLRGDRPSRRRLERNEHYLSPGGYAVPEEPIPVVLVQDEEARGTESEASKLTPPAYGLWRGSVRVDPNRLFWQRNETMVADARPETRTGPRPPSYASDDGVSYVIDAAPRSTAPTTDVPLPPHPSEAGSLGH
ncbi:hypothetical protein NLU13_6491 [Sarocladium strictum]|uniref:Uncharacterized protein n=1 Tax=Sarocladium strictum TaxID=5046 RepID=A0AA39L6S2_SARSR|nr:hypothetical protein NLU13_6491 [Sarocladium strictum]